MNNPLHHLETLRDNLVKTIADLETMFRMPVLIVDTARVPDINIFVEEWKKHQSKILPLPAGSYEFSYRIEDKYQEMIDKHKEYLQFVNQEIRKHSGLPESAGENFFHVWSEGYASSDGRSDAIYLGSYFADTFKDACIQAATKKDMLNYYDERTNKIYGCNLFDNEVEARKSFG